ncbi:hypothetical protein [Ralstonia pseudosolanacearum]|uniref:hypothetical protein n=1 Tax=Ralstonia pseudosolanacearum TaxID=1310165 RepID=UPI001FF837B7|nr:hypothetical protein [Ralstonia pseudosolanacearum]
MKTYATLCCAVALTGCGAVGIAKTQFRAVDEPTDGERARVRVIANSPVKAMPNRDCIDWDAPGAGIAAAMGPLGSSGYLGRLIGMPDGEQYRRGSTAEFYVAAGQPYTLVLITGPESSTQCSAGVSFVPNANTDYEATLLLSSGFAPASQDTRTSLS